MRPKPAAFNPFPHSELSGIHTTSLPEVTIWEIAKNTAGREPGRRTIYARADVRVEEFLKQKLSAVRDDSPFERHTSISGWPKLADLTNRKNYGRKSALL
jgi:hypothetical protein